MVLVQDTPGDIDSKLSGFETDDILKGLGGNDTLLGLEGNDLLDGGQGSDRMEGGTGDDIYIVVEAGDQVIESIDQGNDTVRSYRSYSLQGKHVENLELFGNAQWGEGNNFSNKITGNSLNNSLHGWDGNDTLDGGEGADYMSGGHHNDTYYVDNVGDAVIEYADGGTDKIISSRNIDLSTTPYVENLTLIDQAFEGHGNALDNVLTGNNLGNYLHGQMGDDTVFGMAGDDFINGGQGGDRLFGGIGNDTVYGGTGADYLVGTFVGASPTEVDVLRGSGASGLTPMQTLSDMLTSDTFVLGENLPFLGATAYYNQGGDADYAIIKDFMGNIDKIQVVGSLNQYSLQGLNHSGGAAIDTGVYYQGDLVAVIQDTTNVVVGRDFVIA